MQIINKYLDIARLIIVLLAILEAPMLIAEPLLQTKLADKVVKSFDNFGAAVAISEEFTLVGTPGQQNDDGEACVFQRQLQDWTLDTCFTPVSNASALIKQFGSAVSLTEQSAIVSATLQSSGKAGAVYIFNYQNGNWSQQQELLKPDAAVNDYFGKSVSISGDFAIVGSPGGANDEGAVYVYKREGAAWILNLKITPDSEIRSKNFGSAVGIADDYLIIGDSEFGRSKEGSAYIYKYEDDIWTRQAILKGGVVTRGADYAGSVSISAHYAVIGAKLENDPDVKKNMRKGAVYVYKRDGKLWQLQTKLTASDGLAGDNFGSSVAVSGEHILVGSEQANSSTGSAQLFRNADDVWQQVFKFVADDGNSQDHFGHTVAVSDSYLTVGASNKKAKGKASGEVYVYSLNIQKQPTQTEIALENTLAQLDNPTAYAEINPDDLDGDGLNNIDEITILNTDPNNPDSDGDGLTDQEEVTIYQSDPTSIDTDSDGLTDLEEIIFYNSEPNLTDSDGDGITDSVEVAINTEPSKMDSDGDGFTDIQEVNEMTTSPSLSDTDGDGLTDNEEINIYQTDPLVADTDNDSFSDGNEINNYDTMPLDPDDFPDFTVNSTAFSPSHDEMGTIAFEDNWPRKGDYDFNDAVINYNVTETKVNGLISKVVIKLQPVARGASLQNSLRLLINTPISNIASATIGSKTKPVILEPIADGNQTLFIIIDNIEDALPSPEGFQFANTQSNSPKVKGTLYTVTINLNSPVDSATFGAPPYNCFISRVLSNGEVIEVHFPGYRPTKYASKRKFGENDDNSDKEIDRYYQTANNLPWAMIIPHVWHHPKEKTDLSNAYPDILDWASSRGKKKKDWYNSKRKANFVFDKVPDI